MALPAPDALPNKGHDLGGAGVNEDEIYVRYNRLHFTLKKDETVIIDYSQAITTEIDVDAGSESSDDSGPHHGSSILGDVIQRISTTYVNQTGQELGYEEDSFVDDEDIYEAKQGNAVETEISGFFVNAGDIKTKKRARGDDGGGSQSKKSKTSEPENEGPIEIHPEVEAEIQKLEQEFRTRGLVNPKTIPKELEPMLLQIGSVAMRHHPSGFISRDVIRRLQQFINLTPATLKQKMRESQKRQTKKGAQTSSQTPSAGAAPNSSGAAAANASSSTGS